MLYHIGLFLGWSINIIYFVDSLAAQDIGGISGWTDNWNKGYLGNTAHFVENHDEQRAVVEVLGGGGGTEGRNMGRWFGIELHFGSKKAGKISTVFED